LKHLDKVQKKALPRWGEEIDAIEVKSTGEGGSIGFGGQPFSRIAASEGQRGDSGLAVQGLREEVLACAGFAFDGCVSQAR
jgi:hypothetical protein